MLTEKAPELLDGIVEVDETYVGGKDKNKHRHKKKGQGNISGVKTMVWGAVQRESKVRVKVIPEVSGEQVSTAIASNVAFNSTMVTDEHKAYTQIGKRYDHRTIKHCEKEDIRKEDILVHTNNIEGYWNILKKQIDGIHHSVSPKHLQRYCNESAFRYNNRKTFQDERFANALANCSGNLKYKKLTGKI